MKVYSIAEVAEIFGVREDTVHWWRSQDPAFPPTIRLGASWGLSESALAAWRLVKSADGLRGSGVSRELRDRGAVWTVERVLALLRGVARVRGVSVRSNAALARALGVHPGTVRRWLRPVGEWRGAPASIPEKRLKGYLAEVAPSVGDREREEFQRLNALEALRRLRSRRVPFEAWSAQNWLDEHRVWVLDLPSGLSSVRFARVGAKRDRAEPGSIHVRSVVVANRFEAVLVKGAVLRAVDSWRVRVSGVSGGSELWVTGAGFNELDLVLEEVRREVKAG